MWLTEEAGEAVESWLETGAGKGRWKGRSKGAGKGARKRLDTGAGMRVWEGKGKGEGEGKEKGAERMENGPCGDLCVAERNGGGESGLSHLVRDAPDYALMAEHLLEQVVPVLLLGAPRDPGQRHMLVRLLLLELGRSDVSGHGAQLASDQRQDEASAAQPARVGVRASFPGGEDLVLGCLYICGAEAGRCIVAEVG